ncbi:MAG: PilT/PilU family type 4a pilus ATPase [Desulfobacterales bacterium]|nr:PilT/PilU family type 4a pilus ATPase [Desulfobacterales bacterium]
MSRKSMALFSRILQAARQVNASDIHFMAGLPPAYRVSGEIIMAKADPLTPDALRGVTESILTREQQTRFEKERELCISYFHEKCGRIRVSLYHRIGIHEMSIRMCNLEVKSAEELMLPDVVDELAKKTAGLIIMTGPTSMGKTTTMNYIIDSINSTRRAKIITIEDPVEFEHVHRRSIITQIEVGTDTHDFSRCLRHVLRLDPDVIAIGEMRDLDTMETALTAAETGHLVLATLHTPSAAGTVERIVSSFDGPRQPQALMQLSSTMLGIIAHRLITSFDKKRRVLATEVLIANTAVRNLIREKKINQLNNIIATSRAIGMHSMEDCLAEHYRKGLITLDQALSVANEPDTLEKLIGSKRERDNRA